MKAKQNIFRLCTSAALALLVSLSLSEAARAGLIVEYKFDGNALDTSGNGQHLTLSNGASIGTGQSGGGLVLDGSNDYARVNLANFAFSQFTVEAWVKVATYGANVHYVSLYQNAYIVLGDYGNGPISTWANGLNPIDAGGTGPDEITPSVNAWHHLAFTYDGLFQRIYVDGILQKALATTGTLTNNAGIYNQGLTIGARYSNNTQFVGGSMDNVRIYNNALAANQLGFFTDGVTAVPTPGALALLGLGLLGVGATRRRLN